MSMWETNDTQFYTRAGVLAFGAGVILGLLTVAAEPKLQAQWQREQLAAVLAQPKPETVVEPGAFDGVQLTARAAVVYDVEKNQLLYAQNPDTPLPLASITKLLTAAVAKRDLGADAHITIPEMALETEGESGLVAGDIWRVQDLIDYMLVVSSNDAATALALADGGQQTFIERVNAFCTDHNLQTITVHTESGLDVNAETEPGAMGSAREVAHMLAYIAHTDPDLLAATTFAGFNSVSLSGARYPAVNTNEVVAHIPNMLGGKTGYTDLAGGNLAIIFNRDIGSPVVIVVLGSTREARFSDVLKLLDRVL